MAKQRQIRQKGDRRTVIAITATRPDGSVENLTNLTAKFTMVDSQTGAVKVTETSTGVTITGASGGLVQYTPQATDVDTPGVYYAYFTFYDGSQLRDTFPAKQGDLEIVIEDRQG